ncbi:MAG: DNA repair protein RadC [Muribaculaceae bacterium]|nr:DNA repair protein RadC [Muribaculaceae bacterium]
MEYPDNDKNTSRALKEMVAENDRPREKAKNHGFNALTIPELLAIIVGSGSVGESVTELCQRILRDNDNKLYRMARMSIRDLVKNYRGIGEVKAIEILAALELGRRYHQEKFEENNQIRSSLDAYNYLKQRMEHLQHEEIHVLMLDRAKRILRQERVSSGGTAMTVGDVKMILKPAIEQLADGIILAHNHPSDTPRPSEMDNSLTSHVKQACNIMGIEMVDHIIVCRGGRYFSYLDNGKL